MYMKYSFTINICFIFFWGKMTFKLYARIRVLHLTMPFSPEHSCLTSIKYQHTRARNRLYLQQRQLPDYQFVKALEKQQEQY